jgi:hypothetical protein
VCDVHFHLFIILTVFFFHLVFVGRHYVSIRAEFRIVISLRFPHKTDVRFVLTSGQLFLGGLMSYLRYLCLFAYSGVQHILCYVFLRLVCPMLPVSLDCFCYVFLRLVYPMLPVSLDCFCYVFLRLVYPMLPVSLDCFCYVFLRLVYPMLPVSLDCFCYVFLRLVYPMFPVSLDCPFLFATSVFSKVYFHINDSIDTNHMRNEIKNNIHVLNILSLNYLMWYELSAIRRISGNFRWK